ncbi:transmembrane amino acid transporter protein-domain-containing protein [Fusarium oxysporum Fo47]|uniref:transmembrane amino acid transporter protein-domain-containing protein n=1 Tax=Fusarium oxysporum Fo47 TaxID=660027 RepID=UPI002869AD47|nr:transmembrane amino acid transporter protein-domain-containing protein [Fusarium oxysporum Fo47]WJG34769.1 transmembrane amino acid transporter protein-domain-containing protein [Fusarium oxysporum Fo47]
MASPSRIPSEQPPRSASPSSFRPRSISASVPRADLTARLASPIPSQLGTTPPRGGSPRPDAAPRAENLEDLTQLPGSGTSAQGPGQSPPRHGTPAARVATPPIRSQSPLLGGRNSGTPTNYGSFNSRSQNALGTSAPYEDPEIVKRHLVQPSDDNPGSEESSIQGNSKGKQPAEIGGAGLGEDEFSSLKLQGGDVTRGIYKWTEQAEARAKYNRSKSFDLGRPEPEAEVLDINSIKVPGGFRRNHLRRNVQSPGPHGHPEDGHASPAPGQQRLFTSSFLEFLTIYGHFAGEELEEDDEDLGPNEYFSSGEDTDEYNSDDEREPMEDSALLTPSRRRRKRKVRGGTGNNSPMNAALLLLKSFVGTGVLFLPRAYLNGGMLFSNLILFGVAALSYYCFVLLVQTQLKVGGSFGDLGGALYGKHMRTLILASIVISQIGFVAAYTVFTAANLQAFVRAVSDCKSSISIQWLILIQMLIFLPFALLRDIGKLAFTALVADAFILIGLAYLLYYDILTLNANGISDIIMFNKKDWTLFIGTAIFTFEGIGLIIPVQESMRHPQKFPRVLLIVMIIITVLFIGMGAISYAAYGSHTETVVLLNLPQDNKMVNGVQFLYSVAILLSTPLQIFPAIRIAETELFTRSGKYNPWVKWQKNVFRFFVVMLCAAIAWLGADHLDKFVALVGNFACIPLVFIYPPMLHYKAIARTKFWKVADILLCIFGFIAMAYATTLTAMSWATAEPKHPGYCDEKGTMHGFERFDGRKACYTRVLTRQTRPPPPPPFQTVATCPEPTCGCAATPAMPEDLPLDREGPLKGAIAGYAEHVLPFHNISVLNSSFPSSVPPRPEVQTTSVYLVPSFKYVPFLPRVSFDSVEALAKGFLLPRKLHPAHEGLSPIHRDRLTRKEGYQGLLPGVQDVRDILVLICGHTGRDARCGIMAPVLQTEFEDKLEMEGFDVLHGPVQVNLGDKQRIQGETGEGKTTARVGLISHIGGHKFAGNVIIYLPPDLKMGDEPHPLAGCGICRLSIAKTQPPRISSRSLSTSSPPRQHASEKPDFSTPLQSRIFPSLIVVGIILVSGGYYLLTPPSRPNTLNEITFVPYGITAREAISPTSFVITAVPRTPNPSLPYLNPSDNHWRYPLWSVEFKQPEVQISRHYTPLPPLSTEDPIDGSLRFYIRTVGDGEMSNYLGRRQVGEDVFLRGPHVGFELAQRLGEHSRLVFLAGGTGVVPGIQAAKAVLEANEKSSVDLLWAVRKREEVQKSAPPRQSSWKFWQEKKPTTLGTEVESPSPVTKRLQDLKIAYGDRLRIQVVVDEEGTRFQDRDISNAIAASPGTVASFDAGCRFHDQAMHVHASEFALAEGPGCVCKPSEGTTPGKNLFIVSGPDGFIEYYAGPKIWLGGQQTQGPVSGIAGYLQKQNPLLARDWLVLKM